MALDEKTILKARVQQLEGILAAVRKAVVDPQTPEKLAAQADALDAQAASFTARAQAVRDQVDVLSKAAGEGAEAVKPQ